MNSLIELISSNLDELISKDYVRLVNNQPLFTNKFYFKLGNTNIKHFDKDVVKSKLDRDKDEILLFIRQIYINLKNRNNGKLSKATLNKCTVKVAPLFTIFLSSIFGKNKPIPYIVTKPDGSKLRVGDSSKRGLEAFTLIMMNADNSIDYDDFRNAIIRYYSQIDYTTSTVSTVLVDKWQGVYLDYMNNKDTGYILDKHERDML